MEKVPTCHTFKWLYYLCLPGACVYNSSCKEIMSHFDVLCVRAHVCVCVCVCVCVWIYAWVCESRTTIQPPGLWVQMPIFSAPLLHTEPSEPSAVYTLPLLLLALSLFISHTHSHAHLFSLRLSLTFSLHLPPAPYSTSPFLTHSRSLVFLVFSLTTLPPSLFITVLLCIYLCRSRLIQTQTVSNSIKFRQTLRVSLW